MKNEGSANQSGKTGIAQFVDADCNQKNDPVEAGSNLSDFAQSLMHSAVRSPYEGLAQIVDHHAGEKVMPAMTMFAQPEQVPYLSDKWHSQQIGSAIGMMVPFGITALGVKGISSVGGRALVGFAPSLALTTERAALPVLGAITKSAATGFLFDAFMNPLAPDQTGRFWENRVTKGFIGATTLGLAAASGAGLMHGLGRTGLTDRIAANFLSGIPAGYASAELHSRIFEGRAATGAELGQAMYSSAFAGGVLAVVHGPGAKEKKFDLKKSLDLGVTNDGASQARNSVHEAWSAGGSPALHSAHGGKPSSHIGANTETVAPSTTRPHAESVVPSTTRPQAEATAASVRSKPTANIEGEPSRPDAHRNSDVSPIVYRHPLEAARSGSRNMDTRGQETSATYVDRAQIHRAGHPLDLAELPRPRIADLEKSLYLGFPTTETVDIPNLTPETSFKSSAEFWDTATKPVETTMNIYTVANTFIEIAVPEAYDIKLNEVRAFRLAVEQGKLLPDGSDPAKALAAHEFGDRILPEELVPFIMDLPNRTLLRRVNLLPHRDPLDPWMQRVFEKDFSALASAYKDGSINFYAVENGHMLGMRTLSFHEWSHLQKYASRTNSNAFDLNLALKVENQTDYSYAEFDKEEHWAVTSECYILAPHADCLLDFVSKSPIRSYIFGLELQRSLNQAKQAKDVSPNHEQFKARALLLSSQEPIARARLRGMLTAETEAKQQAAIRLLGRLQPATTDAHIDISYMESIAHSSPNGKSRHLALKSLIKLTQTDPQYQIERLAKLTGPDSKSRDQAVDRLSSIIARTGYEHVIPELTPDIQHEVLLAAASKLITKGNCYNGLHFCDTALKDIEANGFANPQDRAATTAGIADVLIKLSKHANFGDSNGDWYFQAPFGLSGPKVPGAWADLPLPPDQSLRGKTRLLTVLALSNRALSTVSTNGGDLSLAQPLLKATGNALSASGYTSIGSLWLDKGTCTAKP